MTETEPATVVASLAGSCGETWQPDEQSPHLRCRIVNGHDFSHQAYYRDRLYEWERSA